MPKAKQTLKARAASTERNPHHGNRYGRSEAARQAVLEAADNLLVELGFAGITVEAIAARAGVGKQTIYRWWKSKTAVLLDAFLEDAEQHLNAPDTGGLAADLCAYLRQYAQFFALSDAGAVFRALIGEAQHDAALATEIRSRYLDQQRARDRLPLARAVARGELRSDVDIDPLIEALIAPIHYRVLVSGEPVTPDYTDHLVLRILTPFGVRVPGRR